MKRAILTTLAFIATISAYSQLSYIGNVLDDIKHTTYSTTDAFWVFHWKIGELTIQNENLDTLKNISIPDIDTLNYKDVAFVTQSLFDDDEGYEYGVRYKRELVIYDDDNTILFRSETTLDAASAVEFFNMNNTIYMKVIDNDFVNNNPLKSHIYKLGAKTVGLQNVRKTSTSSAYPNPATESVNISYDLGENSSGVVTLTNTAGVTVEQQTIFGTDQSIDIDIESLNTGIYTYTVSANFQTISSGKLVVE